jgi:flavin reductase (DIM6/NTAB) family NADH-FMN oxidoreductase RutF
MSKKKLGPQPMLWPHPAVLVGALTDGKPDFAAAAWAGVAAGSPPAVTIGLQPHRHSLKGIYQNRTFSVNIPSVDLVRETDYCGIISGSKTDKVKDCGLEVFYGELKTAPMVEQCPINLECQVLHLLNLGSHILIVGKIMETYFSEDCLTDGRPDMKKARPFVFGPGGYFAVGDFVAEAFKVGREIKDVPDVQKPRPPG